VIIIPNRAKRPCKHIGCAALVDSGFCIKHTKPKIDKRESASVRGYDSKWRKVRQGYLLHHPLCVSCKQIDILTTATVVDHIKPHKGDKTLFWDKNNWQALCISCHNRKTAKEDGAFGNTIK
jgi:5-methylcytosine-specific restriction protein A